jgi:FkbM family methyltransferase
MSAKTWLARAVAKSPLHGLLRWCAAKLERYLDLARNFNNCDMTTNGELFLLRHLASHIRMAVDIGAHVGDWTGHLLALGSPVRIHAFEPSPSAYAVLAQRYDGEAGVEVHNLGLGAVHGQVVFYDGGVGSTASSFLRRRNAGTTKVLEVAVTTLDRFMSEHGIAHLDLVKIDTEGFEMEVFRGMREVLKRQSVGCVQFEYGGTWIEARETLAGTREFLQQHGYRVFRLLPNGVCRAERDQDTFKYANYLAVASEETLARYGIPLRPAR